MAGVEAAAASAASGSGWSAGIGSAAVSAGASLLAGPQNLFLNKKDREHSARTQYEYYVKQRRFDYDFARTLGYDLERLYDDKNYGLAERYAKNSASWNVEGLRRAGLNPILAAQGALSSGAQFGNAGGGVPSGGSMPSVGGSGVKGATPNIDIAEALRDVGSLDVQSATASKLRADTNVAQAEAEKVKADTTIGILRAMNEERTGGLGGAAGLIHEWSKGLHDGNNHGKTRELLNALLQSRGVTPKNDWSFADGVGNFVDWLGHLVPTRANQPASSSKSSGSVFKDVSNAKELNNFVSPSPFPNPSASPVLPSVRMIHESRPLHSQSKNVKMRKHN